MVHNKESVKRGEFELLYATVVANGVQMTVQSQLRHYLCTLCDGRVNTCILYCLTFGMCDEAYSMGCLFCPLSWACVCDSLHTRI